MAAWYWIGVLTGIGVAVGLLAAGLLPIRALAAAVAAVGAGALAFVLVGWGDGIGAAVGGVAGALGGTPIVAGALRRGGTRGGIALFVALGALVAAGIAFVPVLGFLEVVALPALARRMKAKEPVKHAGLRTLARD